MHLQIEISEYFFPNRVQGFQQNQLLISTIEQWFRKQSKGVGQFRPAESIMDQCHPAYFHPGVPTLIPPGFGDLKHIKTHRFLRCNNRGPKVLGNDFQRCFGSRNNQTQPFQRFTFSFPGTSPDSILLSFRIKFIKLLEDTETVFIPGFLTFPLEMQQENDIFSKLLFFLPKAEKMLCIQLQRCFMLFDLDAAKMDGFPA